MRIAPMVVLWLAVWSASVGLSLSAAPWGRNGHPRTTFQAARHGQFNVPVDVAKVMALGSVAPDYFEFTEPAAHAQTPDPPLSGDGRNLAISDEVYVETQRRAVEAAEKWRERYFSASVAEMNAGHRERAAFLLGYALHNVEDLGTHRGMPNLWHAGMSANGSDPDADLHRLHEAQDLAAAEIARFRAAIGEDSWRLFRGETVREKRTVGSMVPEPLSRLGADLADWDPTSGVLLHPTVRGRDLQAAIDAKLDKCAIGRPFYAANVDGSLRESWRVQVENFFFGLDARSGTMFEILQSVDPNLAAPDLGEYAYQMLEFAGDLPSRYARLDTAGKRRLGELHWRQLLVERRDGLRARLRALHASNVALLKDRINNLKDQKATCEQNGAHLRRTEEQARLEIAKAQAVRTRFQALANAGPPTRNEIPAERESTPREYSRSEPRESRSQAEPHRSESTIDFHSSTFDRARSGNIGW